MMPSLNTQTEALASPLAASSTTSVEATPAGTVFAQLFQALQPGTALSGDDTALLPETTQLTTLASETTALTPELSEDLAHASVLTALASAIHGLNQGVPHASLADTSWVASEESTADELPAPTLEAATSSLITLPSAISLMLIDKPSPALTLSAIPTAPNPTGLMPAAMQGETPLASSKMSPDLRERPVSQTHAAALISQLPHSAPSAATDSAALTSPQSVWANGFPASFLNAQGKQDIAVPTSRDAMLALSGDTAFISGSPELPKVALTSVGFASGLTMANAQSTSPLPGLMTLSPHALLDPSWSDAFGQRIAMLAQQGSQTATLQMNPADLGPIQVRISLHEQSAKVEFNTLQQTTSDLITAAMPRLAAALEQQGMRLDDSRVSLLSQRFDAFASQSGFSPRQDSSGQPGSGSSPQSNAMEHRQALELRQERAAQAREATLSRGSSGVDYYA